MRGWLQRLGLLCVAAGIILAVVDVQVHPTVERYGYSIVVVIAGIAMLAGLSNAYDRRVANAESWRPSATEAGYRVPVPGDEFTATREQKFKTRLHHRVVDSLIATHGCSREEAESHLENGTWTDDRLAAAYLSSNTVRVPVMMRVIGLLRSEPHNERAIRRTVAALRELRGQQ